MRALHIWISFAALVLSASSFRFSSPLRIAAILVQLFNFRILANQMAESSVNSKIVQDLGDLPPIKEGRSHSPLSKSSTRFNVGEPGDNQPKPSEPSGEPERDLDPGDSMRTPREAQVSRIVDPGTPKSKANPPRAIFNKAHVSDNAPHDFNVRRHSTMETNYSESFENTKLWDQKSILSLGKLGPFANNF